MGGVELLFVAFALGFPAALFFLRRCGYEFCDASSEATVLIQHCQETIPLRDLRGVANASADDATDNATDDVTDDANNVNDAMDETAAPSRVRMLSWRGLRRDDRTEVQLQAI